MNVISTTIFLLSAVIMLINAPSDFLPAMLDGGMNAAKCCLTLLCIYCVWMGLSAVAEDAQLTKKAAKFLARPCGAATPYGVKAVGALEQDGNEFAQNLLFIINATSIQLIPTTVIALRASAGSIAAHDIAVPSLIATAVSTFVGAAAYIFIGKFKFGRAAGRKKCST